MTSIAPHNTTTFTDKLPDSSDEIEAVVRAERKQLRASIEELGSAMREKVDVRTQFREHPLAAVGIGFAAGIALGVLSSRVTNGHDSASANRHNTTHRTTQAQTRHHQRTRRTSNSDTTGKVGKFAAAMMGLVGSRVADLAEDTLRDSLSRRRFSVPARGTQHEDF